MSLSEYAKEYVALATMFGYPAQSAKQLGVLSDDDAYAATQALIWQYITGKTSYKEGITGTPALIIVFLASDLLPRLWMT